MDNQKQDKISFLVKINFILSIVAVFLVLIIFVEPALSKALGWILANKIATTMFFSGFLLSPLVLFLAILSRILLIGEKERLAINKRKLTTSFVIGLALLIIGIWVLIELGGACC